MLGECSTTVIQPRENKINLKSLFAVNSWGEGGWGEGVGERGFGGRGRSNLKLTHHVLIVTQRK